MCGIFGYVGASADLGTVVLSALKTLEYRGYDSWGVAIGEGDGIQVEKSTGKIGGATADLPPSTIGFGHTRWATHGGVTWENAHPHVDPSGRVAIIHNGIVDNFRSLRDGLEAQGHVFSSETDSEVIAHLLGEEIGQGADLTTAVSRTFARLDGLNAVIAMRPDSGELVAAKNVSPLVVGYGPAGMTIASDALALGPHAERVMYLEDNHLVRLSAEGIDVYDRGGMTELPAEFVPIDLGTADAGIGDYPTFMAKEMAEQPEVVERLARTAGDAIDALAREIDAASETFLVGCGTASYAAQTGAYLLGQIAGKRVTVVAGSEFQYLQHLLSPRSLVVALSQSGETADIIEAMLAARKRGARLGALVNAKNSTLDRMVDVRVHLMAGPEQCVLSTKAYTAKVTALLLVAHAINGQRAAGERAALTAAAGLRTLLGSPDWTANVARIATAFHRAPHLFVIGRGVNYPTALEAALKIKEVSYIHAEGFAGGELKHGVIALIEEGTPCLVYAPNDETRTDVLSGAMELRSRGGFIIGVGSQPDAVFDEYIPVPDAGVAQPIVNGLPAQLLGYHAALQLGHDPDKPRNLAKSVTVK
ncbi:MAG: Glutamine--fructose-6-phosphate aminotransferase [isomerizing] [uncultured Thermomicrobiales bacterium]|uniref:Glutamine--fructose-6-phosphate aminotransferase [isomerizing] n=1 Tax=uncultured Thermomicrobiales bacterium TaxID=1645740 RepID=A0A6J4UVY3_9BACT|nr:MAG: Glutamine--fructose-6-phosphate aminotransferase [isomerizing] [uncultured Thermomicrobiales bacterium]